MKTRQLPATTMTASFRAKQRDVVAGGRLGGIPCERERKHEAAKREREEQLKRERATAAAAAAAQRVRQHRRMSTDRDISKRRLPNPKERPQSAGVGKTTGGVVGASRGSSATGARTTRRPRRTEPPTPLEKAQDPEQSKIVEKDDYDAKAERLKEQLEELAAMSEQEFEVKFRQWLDQEGIAREMHSHLRVELIHCFNNTALGQLLSKAAAVQMAHSHALLLSPLAMILHTLVAEFLHSQNCHFTLSVFCSETPHRHKLPDFGKRPEFRFQPEELQQVLTAVVGGEEAPQDVELHRIVDAHYAEDLAGQTQCLLLALMRSLVEIRRTIPVAKEEPPAVTLQDSGCQTEPSACLEARPEVDTSGLYQAEEHELILGADGRSVFVGARVSQSLHSVEQQLNQLMRNLRHLAKSCAPPIEVINASGFEDLLKKELRERERLTKAGQSFNPSEAVIKLPPEEKKAEPVASRGGQEDVVHSDLGPIQLPALDVPVPRLPRLHPEQLASLAVVRQSLEKVQKKARRPQGRMYVSVERMEHLMTDVCGCVQLLGNVLNLSMEQEHSVGEHKGFKAGYREGFGHGHFMGVQEGQKQEQFDRRKREKPPPEKQDTASQVEIPKTSKATQTTRKSAGKVNVHTQTDEKILLDAGNQTVSQLGAPKRSYEQWIHEMLHSSSGQVFLERVELSLNKALELQKARLDELYQVKLRHQAEMLRLSRRQNSWRTLCKRVERDSQSSVEAKDLVQKIFRLLDHYESHHQQLAEKIQQTELAAEQAARILPLWTDGSAGEGGAPGNWNSAETSEVTSSETCSPLPGRNAIGEHPADGNPGAVNLDKSFVEQHSYSGISYPFQLLAIAPPGEVPVAGALVAVNPRVCTNPLPLVTTTTTTRTRTYLNPTPPVLPGNNPKAPSDSKVHCVKGSSKNRTSPPGGPPPSISRDGATASGSLSVPKEDSVPEGGGPPVENVLPSATAAISLPTQPAEKSTTLPEPAPLPPDPAKPSMHSVATNTIAPLPIQLTPVNKSAIKSSKGPSFEEALLSAKTRMLQLEQESDLLEQSFLSYLEKAKSKTSGQKATEEPSKARRIRSSCLREREQMNRTLDNFRDWHRRVRKEDAASLAQLEELQVQRVIPGSMLDSKVSSPLGLSEQEEESYPFTNAISEARSKLLGEIIPERRRETEELPTKMQKDWQAIAPPEIPEALNPVKPPELERLLTDITPDMTRSSSNGEMSLLLQKAKEALGVRTPHPLLDSSSSCSSMELPPVEANKARSSKLQQSMAKMQLLFGGGEPAKPSVDPPIPAKRTSRPLSAPNPGSGSGSKTRLQPPRPHTAPTLQTICEKEPPVLHLDISTSSSSQSTTLPGRSPVEAFEDLVTGAVVGGHHRESTPETSYSQAFWKRMNL